jgi:hypothetical protein
MPVPYLVVAAPEWRAWHEFSAVFLRRCWLDSTSVLNQRWIVMAVAHPILEASCKAVETLIEALAGSGKVLAFRDMSAAIAKALGLAAPQDWPLEQAIEEWGCTASARTAGYAARAPGRCSAGSPIVPRCWTGLPTTCWRRVSDHLFRHNGDNGVSAIMLRVAALRLMFETCQIAHPQRRPLPVLTKLTRQSRDQIRHGPLRISRRNIV